MIILGLTGGIATGKSVIAQQFANYGAAVCDSDALVHRLLAKNGAAVEAVSKAFPGTRKGDAIDRKVLGQQVFGNAEKLKRLEAILHPLVRKSQDEFIKRARIRKTRVVVLDIPLLFETQGEKRCDYTVVASAPKFVQRTRALSRPGMTEEKLANILARQMPEYEKRKRADFVVFTGIGKYTSLKMVQGILHLLKK